jgi:DNA-binding NarL/FixJ family response regulator
MSINLLITDDHKMMREGMKQLLEMDQNIDVIGEANDGIECLALLEQVDADILLLDINMPNMNGIETLINIKEKGYPVKVIILTVHDEIDYLIKAIDIGTDGYILKDSDSSELKKAIFAVYNGDNYIEPSLIPKLNAKMLKRDGDKGKIDALTKREKEVLVLVANGSFNKDIADKLTISERTVKNHISNIFKKIDVSDRTQAAVFAIRNGMIHIY